MKAKKEKWDERLGHLTLFGVPYFCGAGTITLLVPSDYKAPFIIGSATVWVACFVVCAARYYYWLHKIGRTLD